MDNRRILFLLVAIALGWWISRTPIVKGPLGSSPSSSYVERPRLPPISPGAPLPEAFAPIRAEIEASELPFIRLTPRHGEGGRRQSKYLGEPYLPKGEPWPNDQKGKRLQFFAQLNFAELPKLALYPDRGIVAFYIANNEVWGIDFSETSSAAHFRANTEGRDFRVRWYPEVATDDDALEEIDFRTSEFTPISQPCVLTAELAREYAARGDLRFDRSLAPAFTKLGADHDRLLDEWFERVDPGGNKIGGYALFIQDDPRRAAPKGEDWLLLLQIDSAEGVDILWGDAGVGNFFIEKKALEKRDFSRVLYYWDNH